MKKPSLIRGLTFDVFATAAILFVAILWLGGAARAADVPLWTKPNVKCVPTVTDFDHWVEFRDGLFAVVWWCSLDDGLYTNWFTGRLDPQGGQDAGVKALAIAGRDPIALERFMVRASSDAELAIVRDVEYRHGPRCYVAGAAKTAAVVTGTAQHMAGTPKLDAAGVGIRLAVGTPVTCVERLSKEPEKRYCAVTGATDAKGRPIAEDAFALCRIEKAPTEGWER